jgi:hypothetical protein
VAGNNHAKKAQQKQNFFHKSTNELNPAC